MTTAAGVLAATWFVHPLSVQRYAGSGAYGDTYDSAATLTGFLDAGTVRNAGNRIVNVNGDEVVSSLTFYLPIDTADVPEGSRVTLPAGYGGRVATVIAAARREAGTVDVPAHLELALS